MRIPNGEDAEKKLMSVLEILKEKVDVSIISLGEECKEKEVFLWFVETHGNMLILQLRPTMPEGKVPEMVSVITKVLEEIESDAECFIVYDLFINPNNFDEVAEEIVKNANGKLVFVAGHYGYVYKISEHPELKVSMTTWQQMRSPVYCFVGNNWDGNRAIPLREMTIISSMQIVPAGLAKLEEVLRPKNQ